MKKYLIFFFAMLVAASSLVLTSCSSDDDETGDGTNYSEMIVGSWTNRITVDDEYYTEDYTRFYADGTYKEVDITVVYGMTDKTTCTGTWSISGNKITTHVNDGISGLDTGTSTITKMTATEMVFSEAGVDLKYTKVADSVFEKYYNQK